MSKPIKIILICFITIVVLGFFLYTTGALRSIVNVLALPRMPDKWRACERDFDCVETRADCCGCMMGGTQSGINKKYLSLWDEKLSKKCKNVGCLAVVNCQQGDIFCKSGKCEFVKKDFFLIAQASYICNGGKTIKALFYKGPEQTVQPDQPPIPSGSVNITLGGGQVLDLNQTISADGGRYANGNELFVFWDKGDKAIVLENGVENNYTGCLKIADKF